MKGRRHIYILLFPLLLPFLLAVLFLLYAYVESPPGRGRPIAQRLGVPYPAVVAHRGASYYAPEETEPAFLLACEMGADYLELDLQRTRDGVLIALHDDTLPRTTDVDRVFPGRENDTLDTFTYGELEKLDAGSWFNAANPERGRDSYKGLKILTLSEVIAISEGCDHEPGLYIETKAASRFPGIEEQLVDILKKRGWIGDQGNVHGRAGLILQSFDKVSLAALKILAPEVPRIYLIEDYIQYSEWQTVLRDAQELGAGLGPSFSQAWPWYTGPAHERHMLVHHWTINESWQMWFADQFGSDGIFTDRADIALIYYGRVDTVDIDEILRKIGY